jgi:hypothetical protein
MMHFPVILAALVIVSTAILLRQFFSGALEEPTAGEPPIALRDDDAPDALKAA